MPVSAAVTLADGGGGFDWTPLVTAGLVFVALVVLLMVLMVGTAVTAVVVGIRRIRRSPTLTTGALAIRAAARQGSSREIARMRLRVRQAMSSTERSLAAARAAHEPVGELPAIVASLRHAGKALDRQLRLAQSDPDPAVQHTIATALAPQVEQLVRTASDVRQAAAQTSATMSAADLDPLAADLTTEAAVLKTWRQTYRRLSQP